MPRLTPEREKDIRDGYFPADHSVWELLAEIDALREERDRLRECLLEIVRVGYTGAEYVARRALDGSTK